MDEQINKATGRALRAMREAKGLSQSELAKELGTSQSAVANWEGGYRTPSRPFGEKLQELGFEVGDPPAKHRSLALATGAWDPNPSVPNPCPYCGPNVSHLGAVCPKVAEIEYHPDGSVKRVKFRSDQTTKED